MDEVSKRKGAREFVTVVSDVERACLLEVIDSHKQQDIIECLKQQPIEVRAQVTEVSVDMWAGFPKVIEEAFPNAGICNYFISGTTSGVMEGINNKIKLIMRLGYGLTNFNNLRSRLLGCCC